MNSCGDGCIYTGHINIGDQNTCEEHGNSWIEDTLGGINQELYDSVKIDGASRWQQTIFITLPMIVPMIITVFILNLGFFLSAGFDQVFNLMNAATLSKIDIIDTYVYRIGLLQGNFSLSIAAGLFKSFIGFFLILITHYYSKKLTGKGLW